MSRRWGRARGNLRWGDVVDTVRDWLVRVGERIGSAFGAFVEGVIEGLDDVDPWW